jgi:hypothetical protein
MLDKISLDEEEIVESPKTSWLEMFEKLSPLEQRMYLSTSAVPVSGPNYKDIIAVINREEEKAKKFVVGKAEKLIRQPKNQRQKDVIRPE